MRIENQGALARTQMQTNEADAAKPAAGAGATAASDAALPEATLAAGLSLLGALRNFMPAANAPDFEIRLAEIAAKMKETQGNSETDRVVTDQEIKKQNLLENQARIEEAQKKMDEANAKRDDGGFWGKFTAVAQILGGLAVMAAGAVTIAAGIGVAVFTGGASALVAVPIGAGIVMSGALMAFSGADEACKQWNDGKGIVASVVELFGAELSDEWIMGLNIATTVTVAAATLAVGLAMLPFAIFSGGAAQVAALASLAPTMIQSSIGITNGVGDIARGVTNIQAAKLQHEAADMFAESDELNAMMSALDDLIDQALAMMMASSERFNAMIDEAISMMKDTGDVMSNQRFAV
ncbi:hypothetical protein [Marivita sp. GX14005]|uniref:hypothetical protein n=1 Tax=Marivita sp. GX14005 TaxID=2942276 RepID=UPI002018A94C|nr:hypothetical protein [Marivita sp. GX14005]MCL3883291.1 hypothetical protein [Marivita sp. GX14005]